MFNFEPILRKNRSSLLKPFLFDCFNKLKSIPQKYSHIPLITILTLWDEESEYFRPETDIDRQLINEAGINGEELRIKFANQLDQLLNDDEHLKNCCGSIPLNLATIFDFEFLSNFIKTHSTPNEYYYNIFENYLYSSRYQRYACGHFYNLNVENSKNLKFKDWTIRFLTNEQIALLLGEQIPFGRLHIPETGNYFAVYEDSNPPNDSYNWIHNKIDEARYIEGLFRYYKDGIINMDYYTFFFEPLWVNTVWRVGIHFFGNIRRKPKELQFEIKNEDINKLYEYWIAYISNFERFNLMNNYDLGKSIQRAAIHFSNYHSKDDLEEKFIDLIISLESLFAPGTEVNYRLSHYAAIFLGESDEGLSIYNFIRNMLKKRNNLFHGSYDYTRELLSKEEVSKFASYIRRIILGYIILYLRGETIRKNITDKIEQSLIKPGVGNEIREKADPRIFIEENIKKN